MHESFDLDAGSPLSVLSDGTIIEMVKTGRLGIEPFNEDHVQPASYDVTLATDINMWPGDRVLAETHEYFTLPATLRGELSGRSSVARLFVAVHCTGGYIDPGFEGTITFELMNESASRRQFKAGDRLAQVSFTWLDRPARNPYRGRYFGQRGPTESRFEHGDK